MKPLYSGPILPGFGFRNFKILKKPTIWQPLSNAVDESLPFVEGYNVRVKPVKILFAYRRCYCSQFNYQRE